MGDEERSNTPTALARKSPIQAVDRASALLEAVAAAGPAGLGLSAIAEQIGIHASTARTLLSSLVIHGLVSQDPASRRYTLGSRIFELTRLYGVKVDLASAAAPFLRRLWDETRETVHLAVLQAGRRVDLAVLVSPQLLNVNPTVAPQTDEPGAEPGRLAMSLFTTAAGKVLLAWAPEAAVDAAISEAGGSAPGRAMRPDVARGLLADVRAAGSASNIEDEEPGVCGIAVPVHDSSGAVCAALCIGYPAVRRTEAGDGTLLSAIRSAASDISRALGAVGDAEEEPDA